MAECLTPKDHVFPGLLLLHQIGLSMGASGMAVESEVHDFGAGVYRETADERRVGGQKRSAEGLTQRGVEGVSRGEITTQHPRRGRVG